MNSYKVYDKISFDEYQNIKQLMKEKYKVYQKESSVDHITDSFEIRKEGEKIHFTYYKKKNLKKNKLVIESNPNNKDFINIIKEIDDIHSSQTEKHNYTLFPLSEDKLDFDYYVGCDESGKGETFGSLYLGCALIKKENLKLIEDIIDKKNIRKLKNNIRKLKNNIQNKYEFLYKEYSAKDIDNNSLTVLLDKGYIQLLSKIIDNKENLMIAIDDYLIGRELKDYLETIKKDNVKVIVENKADENYTACKIASLGARALRVDELEELDNKFSLVDESTGKTIYPSSGSASNSNTEKYLIVFRKQNPSSDFPSFVRNKWGNVKSIDMEYPKQ
jgi:ribonuclease HIII